MRMRLIGVLAALMMIAPVAGFARTSTPITQEAPAATSAKKSSKKSKKSAHKAKKSSKKSKSKSKKKEPTGRR